MSYPKKPAATTKTKQAANAKLADPKREKLLAIQEREQLKGLLVTKFLEKYGKTQKADQDFVNKKVNEFMKNEKLTEENLKKLEQQISDGVGNKGQVLQERHDQEVARNADAKSVKSQAQSHHAHPAQHQHVHHHHHDDDGISVASSDRPRSVYAQGDEDDEWATMMKYDTELFKKEKELVRLKEHEQKKKIKDELDRQIAEKARLREVELDEKRRYNQLVDQQMGQYDVKEKKKEDDMKRKIMQEKSSRDKQLADENLRKKMEKKAVKDMDHILVSTIQKELADESRQAIQKKVEDKESLKRLLYENEEYKKKMADDARREKEADIAAQKEYTRLIEKQMAEREAEFQAREDRAKKFMSMMADTVVKDQKGQILAEEKNLLKQYMEKEVRDAAEDARRQQRLTDQKKDIKNYLDKQMEEKERRRLQEKELEKKQADIWKKDTHDYFEYEKNKAAYVKDVNKGHAEYLKKQMEQERKRNKKPMSTEEMLLNKPKLKEIAVKEEAPFQKHLVNPKQH